MNSSLPEIEKRIDVEPSRAEGIMLYDEDNLYPQRIRNYTNSSGTATSCIRLYAKFMRGKGMQDKTFYKAITNKKKQTVDHLLRLITKDKAQYNGFAIHVGFNGSGKIISATHIPFEWCRLGDETKEENAFKIAIYDDWDRVKRRTLDKNLVQWYDRFDGNIENIKKQIADAGISDENKLLYPGQILYVSDEGGYPLATYDAIIEDIITDSGIKDFRLQSVTTSFLASHIVEYPYEFNSQEEREQEKDNWRSFQGTKNANKIIMIENKNLDKAGIKIHKIDLQVNDKLFEITNRTCKDSIIESFGQPPQLLGVSVAGKLGTADEIKDAYDFYNSYTEDERINIEEVFSAIFSMWHYPINSTGNYSIIPLSFGADITNIAQ